MSTDHNLQGRAHIDKVDAGVARLLVGPDGDPVEIDIDLLPDGAVEGSWVTATGIDRDLDADRRRDVQRRLDQLKTERQPGRFGR